MIVRVIDFTGMTHVIPGPPDLRQFGNEDRLVILGEPTEMDKSTWALAIGLFIMRGGKA